MYFNQIGRALWLGQIDAREPRLGKSKGGCQVIKCLGVRQCPDTVFGLKPQI